MNTVTHLAPCVNSMAISAKQAQVAFVGFPVLKPVNPVSCTFSFFELFVPVNVVNVKNAMVINSARYAFTTKRSNKSKLFLPIFWVLMGCKAVFIPIVSSARVAAKPVFAFFAAIFTRLFFPPSMGQVASLTAKFSSSILKSVGVYLELLRAVFAALCNLSFFAHINILNTCGYYKPKYFDIACKRIEQAHTQGQLFAPDLKKQVQLDMLT